MENVFDWAKAVEQKKRKAPNKQLQQELFGKIMISVNNNADSSYECVQALMKFAKEALEPFYKDYYPQMSDTQKEKWDEALSQWANSVKPTETATTRIAIIIREKLRYVQNADSLQVELRWLSLNEGKRSVKEYENLRKESTLPDLRKLLTLNVSAWKTGQVQIQKMYEIIFSGISDPVTKQLYLEFLTRHGWNAEDGKEQQHTNDPQPNCTQSQNKKDELTSEATLLSSDVSDPTVMQDGVALAEALLKWSQEQLENQHKQALLIAEMRLKEQKIREDLTGLTDQFTSLKLTLSCEIEQKEEAKRALEAAKAQIAALEKEVSQAKSTIGIVQQMAENSTKQELDGFRNSLANDLKNTVSDFEADVSDISDAEKAEVYKVLFDELIDTLKHHGIQIEVN